MKSQYITGMIAGASLMLAFVIFFGAKSNQNENGRYVTSFIKVGESNGHMLTDTKTGKYYYSTPSGWVLRDDAPSD